MDRFAFTIILNGLHHLKHNDYYKFILENFRYWVVVEGASGSTGSTSWCKSMDSKYHTNGFSTDGTSEFLQELSNKYPNLIYIKPDGMWGNKDIQVNKAVEEVRKITNKCFLWEIDIDEQWGLTSIELAENMLLTYQIKTGCFLCDYYVGKNLLARGQWGEGRFLPYRRLWNWRGEDFKSHEPPELMGDGRFVTMKLMPSRFSHYSMYFKQDVKFKDTWYSGHEGIYDRWLKLQDRKDFPIHISELLGRNTHWGNTNTMIVKI